MHSDEFYKALRELNDVVSRLPLSYSQIDTLSDALQTFQQATAHDAFSQGLKIGLEAGGELEHMEQHEVIRGIIERHADKD